MIKDLDENLKQKISYTINQNFLTPVFILNEDNGKPNMIFNKNTEGNIFNLISTYSEIIKKYYPKNIKREKSLEKVKSFKVKRRNVDINMLYRKNVFTNEKEEKSEYGLLLTEMSNYVNFVVNVYNTDMKNISIECGYEDLVEEKLAKSLIKNMGLEFRLNVDTHLGIRIINSGGNIKQDFYKNYYNGDINNIYKIKEKKDNIINQNKKIQEKTQILNNMENLSI